MKTRTIVEIIIRGVDEFQKPWKTALLIHELKSAVILQSVKEQK
jgi:hypothetical protein